MSLPERQLTISSFNKTHLQVMIVILPEIESVSVVLVQLVLSRQQHLLRLGIHHSHHSTKGSVVQKGRGSL